MEQNRTTVAEQNDDITLSNLLIVLRTKYLFLLSRWKMLLLCSLLGATLGIAIALIKKPVYTANLSFILEGSSKSSLEGYSNIAAQFGLNLGMSGSVFQETDNIIAIIRSRNMVVRSLLMPVTPGSSSPLLVDRYMDFSGVKKKWKNDERLSGISFTTNAATSYLQDSVLSLFYDDILKYNLEVEKPDKKLDILIIRTKAKDELFAKLFTERLLENVTNFYTTVQTKKASENVDILRRHADSVRYLLNSALSGVAASTDANPNLNPAFQRLRVTSQKKMVDVEMNRAILTELIKNLELAEISLRKETPLMQIIDTPVLPLQKTKISKAVAIIAGMFAGLIIAVVFIVARQYLKTVYASNNIQA